MSTSLEEYFAPFRRQIVGIDQTIATPYHDSIRIVYADWTATGRAYAPIERRIADAFLPLIANTHTEANTTGQAMTHAYHAARQLIKKHVNANEGDILIAEGSGMTGAVNRLQRILGFRVHERFQPALPIPEADRPVVFLTHMEHHSNQVSWLETIADVVVVEPGPTGLVEPENFRAAVEKYEARKTKIAAVTAGSNVTGILTPYRDIAKILHQAGGLCFVDFAAAAPYVPIDMHPADPLERLDAIYFSPHKFLGGVATPGILIMNRQLYRNRVPDLPGGGTVEWTNPWGGRSYFDDVELREDGGTPPFMQIIRTALCVSLKEQMGHDKILQREKEQMSALFDALSDVPGMHILAGQHKARLGILSFYIDDLHYSIAVRILNDRFGVQARGGCSCAGTYGHYLLEVDPSLSKEITDRIDRHDYSLKPGWVRVSVHPTMTDEEVSHVAKAIIAVAENHREWARDYIFDSHNNNVTFVQPERDRQIVQHMERCLHDALV
jgi:selenocysteine lyase/cysteine desulfurase